MDKAVEAVTGLPWSAVSQVTEAIQTVYHPSTTNEQRAKATKLLEEFAAWAPPAASLRLARPELGMSDPVRHFAVQAAVIGIRSRWNEMSAGDHEQLKLAAIEALQTGTKPGGTEPTHFKEKLVQVPVEIAKRDWPQRWPGFIDGLLGLLSSDLSHAELALHCLRTLSEDIFEKKEAMAEERRNDLVNAMVASADGVVTVLAGMLVQPAPGSSPHLRIGILRVLCTFVDWMVLSPLLERTGLIRILCECLAGEADVAFAATDVLLVLVSRKLKSEDRAHVLSLCEHLPLVEAAVNLQAQRLSGETLYSFQKRVCFLLVDLCTLQLLPSEPASEPANFDKMLAILLVCYRHPGLVIASSVAPVWTLCLKTPAMAAMPSFQRLLPQLMRASADNALKNVDRGRSASAPWLSAEFDSPSDYRHIFSTFRNRVLEIVRLGARQAPTVAVALVSEHLEELLASHVPPPGSRCTIQDAVFVHWEGRMAFLEAAISRLPDKWEQSHPQLAPALSAILQRLLMFSTTDPLILGRQLGALFPFYRLFSVDATLLLPTLQKLFAAVEYREASEPPPPAGGAQWAVSEDTLAARRKACSTLLRLVSEAPSAIAPLFGQMHAFVTELSSQGRIIASEHTLLVESLLIVGYQLEDRAAFMMLMRSVIQEHVAGWMAPAVTAAFTDAAAFANAIGLTFLSELSRKLRALDATAANALMQQSQDEWQALVAKRRVVFQHLGSLYAIARRVIEADERSKTTAPFLAECFGAILPNVLSLVRCIHGLWDPSALAALDAGVAPVLSMSQSEKQQLSGIDASETTADFDGMPARDGGMPGRLEHLRSFLTNQRQIAYQVLGHMTVTGAAFYGTPGLADALLQSVFAHVGHIETRHWRPLIHHFVRPLMLRCPAEYMAAVLGPILPPLLVFVTDKLDAEWQQMAVAAGAVAAEDADEATDDIVHERQLRALTRTLLECLWAIFMSHRKAGGASHIDSGAASQNQSPLATWLLAETSIAVPLLRALMRGMTWRDTITSRQSVTMCHQLWTWIVARRADYGAEAACAILMNAMQALSDGYFKDNQSEIIALITDVYVKLLQGGSTAGRQVMLSAAIDAARLREFEDKLDKGGAGGSKAEKQQRQQMRSLLQHFIGQSTGQLFQNEAKILSLPEKLLLRRHREAREVDGDVNVAALFKEEDQ